MLDLTGAMRGPRYLPEPSLVEITVRTIQSRLLLVLSKIVVETIVGVIARAQERYEVQVIDVKQMSSHLHLLCFFDDGKQMAQFMRYINSSIARKVGRLVGWRGPFRERRYSHVVVTNEEAAQVERLVCLLRNGCKEGLVWRPEDWPGATGVNAMLTGKMKLEGAWLDLTGQFRARQRGVLTATRRFVKKETLRLSKLPCRKDLDDDEYRSRVRGLVEMIAEETAAMHAGQNPAETTLAGTSPQPRLRLIENSGTGRPRHGRRAPPRHPRPRDRRPSQRLEHLSRRREALGG